MKVKELIEKLQKYDPNYIVRIYDTAENRTCHTHCLALEPAPLQITTTRKDWWQKIDLIALPTNLIYIPANFQ